MLSAIQTNLITGFLSFLFTLLILSYLAGDNPAFRVAVHIFTGVSAGYIVVVAFQAVVNLFAPMVSGTNVERILLFFPLVMSLFLLGKTSSRFDWMGRPVVAFMVGVGSAAAVAGAVLGTLFPQVLAGTALFDLRQTVGLENTVGGMVTGIFILFGTVVTLAYFQFSVVGKNKAAGKRGYVMSFIALLGQIFIVITLGAIFAGVLAASLAALVDRIHSLLLFIDQVLSTLLA